MSWIHRTLAALGLMTVSVAGVATVLPAAGASASTLPRVQPSWGTWNGMATRPGTMTVGQGGSPFVRHLSWGSWGATSATTRSGRITLQPYCGSPIYQCPVYNHPASVYLHEVRTHKGSPYFSKMRWTYSNRNGQHVLYFKFATRPGATVPAWQIR